MKMLKKYYKWIIGLAVFGFLVYMGQFFGGSKNNLEYETTTIGSGDVITTVSVVGSVTPQKEIQLSFQNSGKIQSILVSEGQKVSSGQILAEINVDDIKKQVERDEASVIAAKAQLQKTLQGIKIEDKMVLETAVSNTQKSVDQAKSTYESTEKSSKADIVTAELALANAQKVYDATASSNTTVNTKDIEAQEVAIANAKSLLAATQVANAASINTSETNLASSEVALKNAKNNLATGAPVQDKNLSKAQEDSFYSAVNNLNEVDNSLRAMNTIITVEQYNKDTNKAYRESLGVQKLNSYNDTLNAYDALKEKYVKNKDLFVITNRTLSYSEIVSRLETLKMLLDESYGALSITYDMLQNSLTSKDLSQGSLESMRTSILSQRTLTTNALSSINATKKNIESLELQRTSNVTSLQNAVDSAEKAVDTAKKNLENVKAQATLQETSAKNTLKTAQDNLEKIKAGLSSKELTVLNAQNALQTARNNLESVKVKSDTQLKNAKATIISSEAQLATARANLTAQSAPARKADIDVGEAQVKQAEANLEVTKSKLSQTKLIAPGEGRLTDITIDVGEQAGPSTVAMKMISEDLEMIESNVAETEIGKVAIGQKVRLDFDAFSQDDIYEGTVSYINMDKTAIDGVIYYKVQITFARTAFPENVIRAGMTANVEIITSELRGTPSISNQALKEEFKNGKAINYVEVLVEKDKKKEVVKKEIQIGSRGDETTQVLAGLEPEDKIILFTKTANGK